MVGGFEQHFPRLQPTTYRITSPPDEKYNCIAWCLEDTTNWWWPVGVSPRDHWPAPAPREETLEAFKLLFASFGFSVTTSQEVEAGVEKVAIFADGNNVPTHGARQLASGAWTSKLGFLEDIEHALHDLEGDVYGTVALILARPRA